MSSKDEKQLQFELIGYSKWEAKPEYVGYSLFKARDGWVVMEITMNGVNVVGLNARCLPTIKSQAIESLKILISRHIQEISK